MTEQFDIIIRNGAVFDGTGTEPFHGDIAIRDGLIVAIGAVEGIGVEEIDAKGKIVTPGFIDLHTHLDGHITWESVLHPATGHGVTTAVTGNCGVGFAPCRLEDRDTLIKLMETVEDISFADLSAGLPWNWESFPDYLDALSKRAFNMDIATLIPHSTLRAFVMGKRCLTETASAEEREQMASIVCDAIRAGAIGVGTSTLRDQKTSDGYHIPSVLANEAEFHALAEGMARAGAGVFQVAIEFNQFPLACEELEMFARVGKASGRPIMYSLKQTNRTPDGWRALLAISDRANAEGTAMHPQVLGRPTGALMGLQTSLHPFSHCPSFKPYLELPIADQVAAMRTPELRAQLLSEAEQAQLRLPERVRGFSLVFPFFDPPNYEPTQAQSVDSLAAEKGMPAMEYAYDLLLEEEGHRILLLAGGNFAEYSLEPALEMMRNPHSVPGLGDAGAHSGIICDASISTYMLSYWTRDRTLGDKLALPAVIKWMTQDCANVLGLTDRGQISVGLRADINVIDYDRINLRIPHARHDLPAGGLRLVQNAIGFVATIVNGEIVHRDDEVTNVLSGRIIRPATKQSAMSGAA
jgi:N-acyl-D-aspartate/D-glutamate deacylase